MKPQANLRAHPAPTLPAVAHPATTFRALTVYDRPPSRCRAVPMRHDRFAPHLSARECAVIDLDDREPISGEMYLVRITSPREPKGYLEKVVQLRSRKCQGEHRSYLGWMMHFSLIRHYGRRLSVDEVVAKLQTGEMSVCDGPMLTAGMRSKIVGRVIGVVLAGVAVRKRTPEVAPPRITFQTVDAIPDIYAMKLSGDCLEPELMDGAEVVFSKTETPKVGDFCIFIMRPEMVRPGGMQSIIKRLMTAIPPHVELPFREHPDSEVHAVVMAEQLNPRRTYMIECERLLAVHKFVGVQGRQAR